MDWADYEARVDTGIDRYDVTPLFRDGETFRALVDDLLAPVDVAFTHVVGIEALGFVLGGAVARAGDAGFVPVRKGGMLPLHDDRLLRERVTDYEGGEKTLELDRESVTDGTRALVVDDWVETGGHLRATVDLLERAGATVAAVTVLRVDPGDVPDLSDDCLVHAVG